MVFLFIYFLCFVAPITMNKFFCFLNIKLNNTFFCVIFSVMPLVY